jgi:hypothetical protein
MTRSRFLVAVALACLLAWPAAANPLKSLYTTIELKSCRQTSVQPDRGAWLCPGLEGYPVYISTADLRTFVSVGPEPEKRRAALQTLGSSNSLFRGTAGRATLEWRFVKRDGKVVPYATIQRYFTRSGPHSGEVLVVTKITDNEDCHVAHIDALANPDAIALARLIADKEARAFDCKADPKRIGKTGRSPM